MIMFTLPMSNRQRLVAFETASTDRGKIVLSIEGPQGGVRAQAGVDGLRLLNELAAALNVDLR